jgi:hypothetical protein
VGAWDGRPPWGGAVCGPRVGAVRRVSSAGGRMVAGRKVGLKGGAFRALEPFETPSSSEEESCSAPKGLLDRGEGARGCLGGGGGRGGCDGGCTGLLWGMLSWGDAVMIPGRPMIHEWKRLLMGPTFASFGGGGGSSVSSVWNKLAMKSETVGFGGASLVGAKGADKKRDAGLVEGPLVYTPAVMHAR